MFFLLKFVILEHRSDFPNRFPGTTAILYDLLKGTCVVHWLSGKARRTELMPKWGRTGKGYAFYTNLFFKIPFLWEIQRKKKEVIVLPENAQSVTSGRVDISREITA